MKRKSSTEPSSIRLLWALLCQRVITDRETNSISCVDIIESFSANALPCVVPSLFVSTCWRGACKETAKLTMGLRVEAPSGKEMLRYDLPDQSLEAGKGHRVNVNISGLKLDEEGEHQVDILVKTGSRWSKTAKLFFSVALRNQSKY